jgi:hypothetical protein
MSARPNAIATAAPAPRKPIKRAKMVGWFDPGQLARTGIEVVVSTLFGRHSDFRLLEALVPQTGECDFFDHTYNYNCDADGRYVNMDKTSPRAEPEIWIDYVSDVGDGWNPTYTMAYYLGLPALDLQLPGNRGKISTHQGSVLIFGGDEVYPTASRSVYEERLVAPYQAAYQSAGKPPHVYAVPGNHDWYDSLVAFTRLFSQRRWFAGWQTHQTRSYFAVKLPRGWWILGTDVQLGSDVDKAQVEYFGEIADKHMQPGDRVILCNAEPHWVYSATYRDYDATVYNESNLKFLDKLLDNKVRVYLAGDLHHYRRHEDPGGNQKITAGGGGAFLHPTHAPDASELEQDYKVKTSFPDAKTSRRMTWGNLKFGLTNPQFGLATGLIYTLTLWAIKPAIGAETNLLRAAKTTLVAALASPFEASWVLAIFLGFLLFTDTHSKPYRIIAGSLHGLTHLFAAFLIGWGSLYAISKWGPGDAKPIWQLGLFAGLMLVGGYIAGPLIMGLYLLISLNGFKRHSNEAFSALKSEDYKHFLRMKIDQNGDLTIFPIGIRRVPRKWRETEVGTPGARYVPDDKAATEPELIEAPIVVRKETTMTAEADARTSLWFTEEMKGFVTFGETDYQRGLEEGKKNNTALMFHLTIRTDDVDEFVTNPKHECGSEGYIRCDRLGGQRPVEQGNGIFNLFVDASEPKRKLMLYRLFFSDGEGQPYTLTGFKDVKDDPGMDSIWKDTSTLYTRILRGRVMPDQDATAEIVASGIIIIHELDFLKQLTTFRVEGPSLAAKAKGFAQFGELFMGSLWTVYASKIPLPH